MTRSGPAASIGQQILRRGGRAVLSRQATLKITGREHIPQTGPCLIVARHYHNLLDGCALYQATDRPLHILVGLDWAGTGLVRRGMELLCRMVDWPLMMRPDAVERAGVAASQRAEMRRLLLEATRRSVDLLEAGDLLVVFPEGYPVVDPHASTPRERPDGLLPFQQGVVRLASLAERRIGQAVPLVPVGYQYQPLNGGRWAIDMRIGPPVLREAEETDDTLRRRLEHLVGQLSGVPGSRDDGSLERGAGAYRDEGRTGTCVS